MVTSSARSDVQNSAVVTGAGRGIGRAHALYLASEGARVVVNDPGPAVDGVGDDDAPADAVVAEINNAGGTATANYVDVSDWNSAQSLVEFAVATFGDLDVLVNNAGILRDRAVWELSEDEYDSVLRVNLKGHVAPTRWAASYWKQRAERDGPRDAAIVSTSSHSGLLGIFGQSPYGASKAGIATFALVVGEELAEFGVRSNVIVPAARTRMADAFRAYDPDRPAARTLAPVAEGAFDEWSPGNSSPLVAYLASADCSINGQVFLAGRGIIRRMQTWSATATIRQEHDWTIDELSTAVPTLFGDEPMVRPSAGSPFD